MAPSSSRRKIGVGSFVGFVALLFFGLVLFQRMWTFQSALSLAQGNAAHLGKLYNEALDEAADWRNKYDADMKEVNKDSAEKMEVLKGELLELKQKCETAKQTQGNGTAANKVLNI